MEINTKDPRETEEQVFLFNKEQVCLTLLKHGIEQAKRSYSGSSDSGYFEQLELLRKGEDSWEVSCPSDTVTQLERSYAETPSISEVHTTLASALESLLYHAVEKCFGGWENDGGAEGEATLNADTRKLTVEHNECIQTYENTTIEL